jgi:phosphoglycerate dehydrogenase-like enzyme
MKIVVTKNLGFYPDQKERLNGLGDVTCYNSLHSSPDEWLDRCKDADVICSGLAGLELDSVYQLKNVLISLPFVGVEFLDLDRLKLNGVTVANSPACNREAVAEWIVGMLLMRFRNLNIFVEGNVDKGVFLEKGLSIWNKSIAILGAGNIGRHLEKILTSFGANVDVFRRGDDLIGTVEGRDVVINCLSANESTDNLLDANFFKSLKKGAYFVSVARSKTYDVDALVEELDSGRLAGAIDDVASAMVADVDDVIYQKLFNHPKVFATPHIAWSSESEARKANDMMIDNIEMWMNGNPQNILNP